MNRILLIVVFIILFESCQMDDRKDIAAFEKRIRSTSISIATDYLETLLPLSMEKIPGCNDSAHYRFVVYYDSSFCSPCQLGKMGLWQSIIKHTEKIGVPVDFEFIFCPSKKQLDALRHAFVERRSQVRIFLDTAGVIERDNPLIRDNPSIRAFMLNDSNYIEVIGNPAKSSRIELKFYEYLQRKRKSPNNVKPYKSAL